MSENRNRSVGRTLAGVVLTILAMGWLAPELALGLGTETIGRPHPVANQRDWAPGVRDAMDIGSRVYSRWVNGNEAFYFRGDADDLNAALKEFAAIREKGVKVVFKTGTENATTFGKDVIPYDWRVQVPSGIYLYAAKAGEIKNAVLHPTMTVQLGGKRIDASRIQLPKGLPVEGENLLAQQRAMEPKKPAAGSYERVSSESVRTGFPGEKPGRLRVVPLFCAAMDAPVFQVEFFHTGPEPMALTEALAAERVVLDGKEYAPRSVKFAGADRLAPHKVWRHKIELANFLPNAARVGYSESLKRARWKVALRTGEHTLVVRFAGMESAPTRFVWAGGPLLTE